MKINEVDPRNFDSDIDYYNALKAKPKARIPGEPRPSPAQQDAEDEDAISQKRQSAHKAFTQKRAVKYVDQEGSAPNGKEYNKLYVIQAQDEATAAHEEYMFDKHEWGAKKVVDVEKEKNEDGSVTHTLYIVDNHKYGMWKPWKDKPAEGVAEGLPQTLRKVVPGYAKREIDKKMDAGKFGKTDADKDANFQRYKKIQDKLKEQGVAEGELSESDNPVAGAITRRILAQRHDLLSKYGPAKVMAAIDDVADFVGDVDEIGSSDVSGWVKQVEQSLASMGESVTEADNPTDVICVDVPLFIRLMEYAREDASTDMDLHDATERLTRLSASGKTVTMDSYDEIVGAQSEIKEADMDLEQGRKNILSILKAAEQGQDAQITVGNEPITLEYPEARFVGGRYKAFMKAGRQEEFLRALTDARAFDRIMTKMRAVLDKQKNFRGSVPGERGVEEDAPAVAKFAGGLGLGMVAAAGAPAIVGILGPLLGIPFAAYGAYSAAKMGMKGVEKLWDMAAEKLGGDDKVEQYTQAKISKLPPDQAQAAQAAIKQVAESRKSTAPNVEEGIVDAVKAGAKKAFKALTGPDDEELLQRLEKETGGQRPVKKDAEEKKESLDRALFNASAQLKENEYFCMLDKQVKLIPEGYKRNSQGYLARK